jgi:hypothetical protein
MGMAKLRIGLLLDTLQVPAWVYKMLAEIHSSNYAKISLVVLKDSPASTKLSLKSRIFRFTNGWSHLMPWFYYRLERFFLKLSPDAQELRNARNLLNGVKIIRVTPVTTNHYGVFADKDLQEISECRLDAFIQLGFGRLEGGILGAAKYGVWSYRFGDNRVGNGCPPGFWEVLEQNPITGSGLEIIDKESRIMTLYNSYSATDPISCHRNQNNFYWKSASFIPRKLKELSERGAAEFFQSLTEIKQPGRGDTGRYSQLPDNRELLRLLAKPLAGFIKRKIDKKIFLDQWVILFQLADNVATTFCNFAKMIPPKDRFWADPQVIYLDNNYYIFIEEYEYGKNKGYISVIQMDENGHYQNPKKILERPYHLSYPFVVAWEGSYYLIPESAASGSIELYKCVDFPDKWEFQYNLMSQLRAFDPTLFFYQDKWWLFANIIENDGASPGDELFLFYSASPVSSDWQPHPQNPIISDVRRARPAGRIFSDNGNIYRPSQDCSKRYGYGIRINQIKVLNEYEYQEEEISFMEPNWDRRVMAIHTINHEGRLTVIDGILRRSRYGVG